MKSRDGKSQRREEEERRSKRESLRRKKIQVREKVGKSRNTVFQWFVAPEGRKVGSLKPRVRSQLARWEMKSCMPLWREARFQVKMYKTPQLRSTFRKLRCRKSARRCGAKHTSKSKWNKTPHVRTPFGSWDVENVHAVVARSKFPSQHLQNMRPTLGNYFEVGVGYGIFF